MPPRHEKQKPKKIERLYFKVEEDVAVEDEEFLNQFLDLLIANNLDPEQLVFSGMDGTPFKKKRKMAPVKGVYAMDLAGWKASFTDGIHMYNPAVYAERHDIDGVPAIGLFDKSQLREAYAHQIKEHPPNLVETEHDLGKISLGGQMVFGWGDPSDVGRDDWDREVPEVDAIFSLTAAKPKFIEVPEDFEVAELGDPIAGTNKPVFEGVVHLGYPETPMSEALIGVVYVEKVPIGKERHA